MNTKIVLNYIVLLYCMYTLTIAKPITEEEIEIQWEKGCFFKMDMINTAFVEIAKKGNRDIIFNKKFLDWSNGGYVTLNEMIAYYPQIEETKLVEVINNYGKIEGGEYRLYFQGFETAMDHGLIPKPNNEIQKKFDNIEFD